MSKLASIKDKSSVLSTLSKDRKFGTDGIRGPVTSTMNPLFVTKLGWAAGSILKDEGMSKVLIGKDTRISGYMFESALQAGFISAGMDVTLLGPLPTPGVSYLANSNNQVGLVISASHNLFEDNGIKFFDDQGRYIEFCKSSFTDLDLNGLSILLDCANGATYSVAPKVFSELGAKVETIGSSPDGININQNCGSTNPDFLKEELMKGSYDLGIAFDGDGDRILIVNSEGEILDGDDILYILSNNLAPNSGVVGTLMTNKALEIYFEKNGIPFLRAEVGDKYVLQRLLEESWVLGGEPSGHIICLDSAPTGDAIVAALNLLNAIKDNNFSVKKSLDGFQKFPQTLINLKVNNPNKIIISDKFWSEVTRIEKQLGQNGRVLIRPSGTEPLIRLMVESDRTGASNDFCNALADLAQTI
jgi:phosphoglucosamine mutase